MFLHTTFLRHVDIANPNISRFKESSLEPLIQEVGRLDGPFSAFKRKRLQELVCKIPFDKQTKYKNALNYLATEENIKICGFPVDPVMKFYKFRMGQYNYSGLDKQGKRQQVMLNPGSFHHEFMLSWKSSNGNLASLQQVGSREDVKFRTSPTSGPFNHVMADVPMQFYHGQSTNGANFGNCVDDHSTKHPALILKFPLQAGEVVAEQWYQYTVDGGASWENIPGAAYLLIKGVRKSGSEMVFYFAKKNWPEHNKKHFHFEVEYKIGPQPAVMPPPGEKLSMQTGQEDELTKYDHKVIAKG